MDLARGFADAESYGDGGCNTLQRLAAINKGLALPNLEQLGLGHLGQFQGIRPMVQPEGCFGSLGFATRGKNSLTGHWEMAGYVIETDHGPCETFTTELTTALEAALGQKTLGNCRAVSLEPIAEFGGQHLTPAPRSLDRYHGTVFLAAHEQVMPVDELYRLAREARKVLKQLVPIVRVVACPSSSVSPGGLTVTERRRDLAVETAGSDVTRSLSRASQLVIGSGRSATCLAVAASRGRSRCFKLRRSWMKSSGCLVRCLVA